MTDLDEVFQGLIDESAQRRAPLEQIETRAREYRRRDRRRHRAQGFLAGAVAIALVVGTIAVVRRGGDTESAPPAHAVASTTTTTTPTVPVPAGWQTYDYGLARLSIPSSWRATTGCPQARTFVMIDPTQDGLGCGGRGGGPSIAIEPLTTTHARVNGSVNGIPYAEWSPNCPPQIHCGAIVDVPALRVRIDLGNAATPPIFQTLTYSTYARLARDHVAAPRDWKTVTYQGVAIRVPLSWTVLDSNARPMCGPTAEHVYLGGLPSGRCLVRPVHGSAWIALHRLPVAAPGNIGPTTTTDVPPFQVRRQPLDGPLAQSVDYFATGDGGTTDMTVGLGADSATLVAIVDSIRPAR